MTQKFSIRKCRTCGYGVGYEDNIRQNLCRCDTYCSLCGRQFIGSSNICPDCIESEIKSILSERFRKTLSRKQYLILIEDITEKYNE